MAAPDLIALLDPLRPDTVEDAIDVLGEEFIEIIQRWTTRRLVPFCTYVGATYDPRLIEVVARGFAHMVRDYAAGMESTLDATTTEPR